MGTELYEVIVNALGRKERTAKVYAATIKRIYKQVFKKTLEDNDLQFIKKAKTLNYVKKIVNLTRRKNAATALLVGLQAIKAPVKKVNPYREIMMSADRDYQKFLQSGQRKRPFANAEAAWHLVSNLHKKVAKEIEALRLWDLGEKVTPAEYRILQAWLYLKWLNAMPPRRLEYSTTRLVTPAQYEASEKKGNFIVMKPRKWFWILYDFKNADKKGVQRFPVPGSLKAAINRMKPIIAAKSDKGNIFLNNKFLPLSRSQFSTFVSWVFRKYAGKKWSQNTIRSIKVSSVWVPTVEDPLQLAKSMGHSVETALLHYKA